MFYFFFSSRRRHTRCSRDWSSDVCSSDLNQEHLTMPAPLRKTSSRCVRMCATSKFSWSTIASKLMSSSTRSEEHTSELQSRLHLVCRLLLEKKKKNRRCDPIGSVCKHMSV